MYSGLVRRCTMQAYLEAPVHQALIPELPEHPPDTLHVCRVQCLVIILEVDPPANALYRLFPLLRVPARSCLAF